MTFKSILEKLLSFIALTETEVAFIFQAILQDKLTASQLTAFLIAMRMKGETAEELFAGVKVLRQFATPVHPQSHDLIDIVGTGGDQTHTLNISTACAFVVAAAGVKVAKHGGRSVSSKSGSADVLQSLEININLSPEQVAHCIDTIGIGFMFSPLHHPAMKHVAEVRAQLGVRTIFNFLGPLTNPADAKFQMIGVFEQKWLLPFAEVLQKLGSMHALIVHSRDGMDEISINAETDIIELKNEAITQFTIMPEDFQIKRASLDAIRVNNPKESAEIIKSVFAGEKGVARDIIILNAGAALYAANRCDSISNGVQLAQELIDTKKVFEKLQAFIKLNNQFV
jgi:anthranilate phosphoribosyltransferase